MAIKSQADQREWFEFTDQHGRPFGANVEIKSKGTVGMVRPMGWHAPYDEWMPDQKYIRQNPGRQMLTNVTIDYDRWLNDLREAWRDRDTLVQQIVTTLPGAAVNPDGTLNPIARTAVGRDPMPLEPVYAMQQGNQYALGLSPVVDERLRKYFPVPTTATKLSDVPDFSGPAPTIADGLGADEEIGMGARLKCSECDRTFARKAALASHMRTHQLQEA